VITKNTTERLFRIKDAFPTLPKEFYDVLCERFVANKFSEEDMVKSIAHVIDTCKYPTPTVAHFISFNEGKKCPLGHNFGTDYEKYSSCRNICRDKDNESCKIEHSKLQNEGR
jgi:hypothetical protein